jgi:hypothetical protein
MEQERHENEQERERIDRVVRRIRALDVPASQQLRDAVVAAVAATQVRPPPEAVHGAEPPVASAPALGRPRRRFGLRRTGGRRWAFVGAAAVALTAVALLLAVVLPGGQQGVVGAPTVRQVAAAALRPADGPAPAAATGGALAVSGDGLAFPDWSAAASGGWRAAGTRSQQVGDRAVTTVDYVDGGGTRVGYAITAAPALPAGGRYVMQAGVPMWVYEVGGAKAVMWVRDGRTCVVTGHGVSEQTLLSLAARET